VQQVIDILLLDDRLVRGQHRPIRLIALEALANRRERERFHQVLHCSEGHHGPHDGEIAGHSHGDDVDQVARGPDSAEQLEAGHVR
jgi:hypothetical protein